MEIAVTVTWFYAETLKYWGLMALVILLIRGVIWGFELYKSRK
jgi:hypothetical protein